LVENAAKYAPVGSCIDISADLQGEFLKFSVTDEGPGIAVIDREKIFQPFFRVNGRTSINTKGAGLGLTICRRLVEAQGGRIWVADRSGPGTEISFTIPLADAGSDRSQ